LENKLSHLDEILSVCSKFWPNISNIFIEVEFSARQHATFCNQPQKAFCIKFALNYYILGRITHAKNDILSKNQQGPQKKKQLQKVPHVEKKNHLVI
jgi:hypothetical protein